MKKGNERLLQVAELGHRIIRDKAQKVTTIKDAALQQLIDDMIATVIDVDGVGIAAPQVYQSLRIFILASHPNPRYPKAPKMKPKAIINPKILEKSKTKTKDIEGCLSIPGIRGSVPRYDSLTVEYTTRSGKKELKKFDGFIARILQHEYDHLEGKVFIDRIETTNDLLTEKEFKKLLRK